jgi:hypothetical protein
MPANRWWMTADIDRAGRIQGWRYPPGVTVSDLEFMGRVADALPGLVDSPTDRVYREPKTVPIDRGGGWFGE